MASDDVPIDPPDFASSPSFEAKFVTEDDLEDLATFAGMTREACLERLRSHATAELTKAWHQANPKTTQEILLFYRSTDLYVWELMQWHASPARRPYWEALETFATRFAPNAGYRSVYDFGCGIGTDALFLAARGYEVTLVDVGGPAFRFARHRFERRGIKARFLESDSPFPSPDRKYDAIVCFDVFEHLEDPLRAVRLLVRALRPRGILVQVGNFEDAGLHPCHLSNGVRRFGGLRWHFHLAGLGLRHETWLLYRKLPVWRGAAQRLRFWLWWATGVWLVRVGRLRG